MADIKPDDIPFVLPQQVRISDETGRPTKAMLDWFQALWGWMKRSVVDLTTKITTVSDEVDGAYAAVTEEQTARIEGDTALAAQITTVEATVDDATANGEIYFAAKAAPTGSTAAYGLYLTAGAAFAGIEVVADSVLGSAIGLEADRLYIYSSDGTQRIQLVAVDGSDFVLNGNLIIRSGTTGARTVITSELIQIYDTAGTLRVRMGDLALMPQGLQVFAADTSLLVDLSTRLSRVLGTALVTAGSSGSISNAGFATGSPYCICIRTNAGSPTQPNQSMCPPSVNFTGGTLNYNVAAPANDHLLIYGVY